MEIALRAALITWLSSDPVLTAQLNSITEEAPSRTSLPWLAIAATASVDWSCKTNPGREVRLALELHSRGDVPDAYGPLITSIGERIEALPAAQPGYRVVTRQFLRARTEQRGENARATLIEYRFRLLAEV